MTQDAPTKKLGVQVRHVEKKHVSTAKKRFFLFFFFSEQRGFYDSLEETPRRMCIYNYIYIYTVYPTKIFQDIMKVEMRANEWMMVKYTPMNM